MRGLRRRKPSEESPTLDERGGTMNVRTGDFTTDDEKVTRSRRIAKSEAFAQVLYLAPRVDRMLKSASAPRLVVQRRAPNFNLISLGA